MLIGGVQATSFPNSMFPTDVPTNPQNIYRNRVGLHDIFVRFISFNTITLLSKGLKC